MTVHVLARLVFGVCGGLEVGLWTWMLTGTAKGGRR